MIKAFGAPEDRATIIRYLVENYATAAEAPKPRAPSGAALPEPPTKRNMNTPTESGTPGGVTTLRKAVPKQ